MQAELNNYHQINTISQELVKFHSNLSTPDFLEKSIKSEPNMLPPSIFDNGLASLYFKTLQDNNFFYLLDTALKEKLENHCRLITGRKIIMENELKIVGAEFDVAGVTAVLSGGFGRIYNMYEDKSLRESADIDLLIAEKDINKALKILYSLDYISLRKDRGLSVKKNDLVIDISVNPGEMLTITGLPAEADLFEELDICWEGNLEKSCFGGFYQFNSQFEIMLNLLHFIYKHSAERMIWALDLYKLIADIEENKFKYLVENLKYSRLSQHYSVALAVLGLIFNPAEDNRLSRLGTELKETDHSVILDHIYAKSINPLKQNDLGCLRAFASASLKVKAKMLWSLLVPPAYRLGNSYEEERAAARIFNYALYYLKIPIRLIKAILPAGKK
ncbi:MAG: nucleotidyltransferase family protein [Planctomycetota bacterium]|jgi:hypothetical protein